MLRTAVVIRRRSARRQLPAASAPGLVAGAPPVAPLLARWLLPLLVALPVALPPLLPPLRLVSAVSAVAVTSLQLLLLQPLVAVAVELPQRRGPPLRLRAPLNVRQLVARVLVADALARVAEPRQVRLVRFRPRTRPSNDGLGAALALGAVARAALRRRGIAPREGHPPRWRERSC